MSSKILKVFLGQFVNTGIIILITNLRIEAPTEGAIWYKVSGGNFDDIH